MERAPSTAAVVKTIHEAYPGNPEIADAHIKLSGIRFAVEWDEAPDYNTAMPPYKRIAFATTHHKLDVALGDASGRYTVICK